MSSYDPTGIMHLAPRERRDNRKTGLKYAPFTASTIAFPFPSTHTYHFNSVQHKNLNKGSSRTDIARWLVASLRLFTDRVFPRGQERVRPDSVAQQRPS